MQCKVWQRGHVFPCNRRAIVYYCSLCSQITKMDTMKSEILKLKLTPELKSKVKSDASKVGQTMSSYIRNLIEEKEVVVKTDAITAIELKRIGTNINQIAHRLNAWNSQENVAITLNELKEYKDRIDSILSKILL